MITESGLITFQQGSQAVKHAYLAIPLWTLSMGFTKMGVAITLLRIRTTWRWNLFLYTIIGVQALYLVGNTLFTLLQCRPLSDAWNFYAPPDHCLSPRATSIASTVTSVVNTSTDVLLSLAPARFIIGLQRPIFEKLQLAILMGLGLIASAASIRKAVIIQGWGDPTRDQWAMSMAIGTLTAAECLLASFAACAVCLKAVWIRVLARCGIQSHSKPPSLPTIQVMQTENESGASCSSQGEKSQGEDLPVEGPDSPGRPRKESFLTKSETDVSGDMV